MLKSMFLRRVIGWAIHAFTASGAVLGLFAIEFIYKGYVISAFWCMAAALIIDAVDGYIARYVRVKEAIPFIDGPLLDNLVDFFNHALVPAFFLMQISIMEQPWGTWCAVLVVFASAYQFTQRDARTPDHFFKGFPSYWNIVVFYLFFFHFPYVVNQIIVLTLVVLSFVPFKYMYPARLKHLTHSRGLCWAIGLMTTAWAVATLSLLWMYPRINPYIMVISAGYLVFYLYISLYRTWKPLR